MFVEALCLPKMWQQITLNTYRPCLACISMLQYLQLKEGRKIKTKAEKQPANPESSQIDIIKMQRKKCRSVNLNLRMQKGSRKGLLKILKSHEDLWKSVSKVSGDDLKGFRNNSEPLRSLSESFEDASEGEIKPKTPSEDLNGDQLEAEWAWLRPKEVQQRLFWHIICDYVWEKNPYSEPSSFFKFIICSFQDFNL